MFNSTKTMQTRNSGIHRAEYIKCSACTVHMSGSQTVHIHSCAPSILCTRCALGSLTSVSYNTWYNQYTAKNFIDYLVQKQEKQEQREQREQQEQQENDAVVAIIVSQCEKYHRQKQAISDYEGILDANNALIDLASSSKNGQTGNTTDDVDWIALISDATSP